ncbi:hypothetical protein G7076_02080 [Sphingomonas sp. HDW15A]|uniref:hypothetical protein n=1 Tax=Sphingomonas sp. HDW15A TaxID=2714942 RepID=UPI00140B23A6|nr:hypothetical protein [Sphingomonas sp. HDW15A]QIK95435.1 hypothetical protein G7076_02080 [Sphingomonas sp. HDW15A]
MENNRFMLSTDAANESFAPWSEEDTATLRGLYVREAPVSEIADYMNRNVADVRQKAAELGLTLISFRHPMAA